MRNWSVVQWLAAIIIIGEAVAIAWIALKAMGIPIPPWLVDMALVVAVVVVALAFMGLLVMVWRSWFGGPPGP